MSQNQPPPIPSLLPESAPFSAEQRAWLNGFFAGYLAHRATPNEPFFAFARRHEIEALQTMFGTEAAA